jgi:undecaprenyl-diphosphatase
LVVAFAWLGLLGASIALSVLAARQDTLPGDTAILRWAQERPFPGQRFSDFVRAVTTTEAVLAAGGGIAVALLLLGRRREALLLAAGLVLLPALQTGLKELVDRPRPAELALSGGPLVELRAGFSSPSFPAGHVMSPTFLYAIVLYVALRDRWPRVLRVAAAAWSAFVLLFAAPPNVWLGVHWPSDVLGGWAWALVLVGPLIHANATASRRARYV